MGFRARLHRQFVFTIPKRLRLYFRYDRSLLGALCQAAWRTVRTDYQATNGRPDGVPGIVGAIQTFGDLVHFHPHLHALVSEGVFLPDGTFLALPKLATEPSLFEFAFKMRLRRAGMFAAGEARGRRISSAIRN